MNNTISDEMRGAIQSNLTDGEDVAFTFQSINDTLKFVEGDLYCPYVYSDYAPSCFVILLSHQNSAWYKAVVNSRIQQPIK